MIIIITAAALVAPAEAVTLEEKLLSRALFWPESSPPVRRLLRLLRSLPCPFPILSSHLETIARIACLRPRSKVPPLLLRPLRRIIIHKELLLLQDSSIICTIIDSFLLLFTIVTIIIIIIIIITTINNNNNNNNNSSSSSKTIILRTILVPNSCSSNIRHICTRLLLLQLRRLSIPREFLRCSLVLIAHLLLTMPAKRILPPPPPPPQPIPRLLLLLLLRHLIPSIQSSSI